ncbi:acetate/propionate family kinase [Roseimaritima sediminicola]|uniref:acetate/propionate family kinase n=1 Tax=Roseimaritima sediminicola TaxID=2662066 RepID=UPI0012985540|nr:acetate kinase [Roseimaritima sediminicola]
MNILCFNPGSGSVRLQRVAVTADDSGTTSVTSDGPAEMIDHVKGTDQIVSAVQERLEQVDPDDVDAVAVRFVHGGADSHLPARRLDDEVLEGYRQITDIAPLHLEADIAVAEAALGRLDKPVYAVFDTTFHRTLPETAWRYPLPYDLGTRYRRYGFHGLAHESVAVAYRNRVGKAHSRRLLSLHFGGGASACSIVEGQSIATTMGYTPLDGLMMSTRTGSIDPAIVLALLRGGRSVDQVDHLLNHESGLLGVSEISEDTRDLQPAAAEGHRKAELAMELYAERVHATVGAQYVRMGGCDAVLLSGNLVKESPSFRRRLLGGLEVLGMQLSEQRNAVEGELQQITRLSSDASQVALAYAPAEEELQMARMVATARSHPG